jgi:hypothetical protein
MSIESRLQNMYRYRDEALKDPVANKLYLEDLAISIPEFERMVKQPKKVFETYRGFAVDEAFKAEEINND